MPVTFLSFNSHRDFRTPIPAFPHGEESTMEMLKNPERHADIGPKPNQRTAQFFINPLSEDAKIAAQQLPKRIKKLKIKKPKVKKPKKPKKPKKKKATVPQSDFIPESSNAKPTPVSSKIPKAEVSANPVKRVSHKTREKIEAARVKPKHPGIPDTAGSLDKAATEKSIRTARSSVIRAPTENIEVIGEAKGNTLKKAGAKAKRERIKKRKEERARNTSDPSNLGAR